MRISVCIPVYGVERFVEKCVRSLFEQTYEDMEFIFVDDCTPDRSVEILRQVLEDYPKRKGQVKILRHETNRGLLAARQTALTVATGDYVAHLDSDDWVDDDYYEKLLTCAMKADADLVYSPIQREWPDGRFRQLALPNFESAEEMIARACPGDAFNSVVNKLMRRDIVQTSDCRLAPQVCIGEDLLYTTQVLMRCRRVVQCAEAVYHYRQNPKSITGRGLGAKRPRDLLTICRILEEELVGDKFTPARDRLRRDVLTAAIKARVMGDPVYRVVRHRLESPLLSDPRHGLLKKTLLCLADLVYWR